MKTKFYDYKYSGDDVAQELAENVVDEFTTALEKAVEKIDLKSSPKLNEHFEGLVNETCNGLVDQTFRHAVLNFDTNEDDTKLTLEMWEEDTRRYVYDLDAALEETIEMCSTLEETIEMCSTLENDKQSKALAALLRSFADRLESQEQG